MSNKPVGEIIEAGTSAFVAQCLEVPRELVARLYDPPPFGSFVKILSGPVPPLLGARGPAPIPPELGARGPSSSADDEEDPFALPSLPIRDALSEGAGLPAAVYALVFSANTTSLEPNRRPSALGFEDEDEMRRQQPQIFELLRTEFSGLLVAYSEGKGLRRHLPPKPPRIHSRVYPCDAAETRALTEDLSFLRSVLLSSGGALSGVPADELAAACLRQSREAQTDDQAFLLRAGKTLATLLADDYERLQAILRNVL